MSEKVTVLWAFREMALRVWSNSATLPLWIITGNRFRSLVLLMTVTASSAGAPGLALERRAGRSGAVAGVTSETLSRVEQHLAAIGYGAGPSLDKPERRRYAILAFQRVEGRHQTGKLDADGIQAALAATKPSPRESGYSHIEVDLQRQVLFVVDQNFGVTLVLPISSGSGKLYTFEGKTSRATTPRGRFTIYRKLAGWRKAPLGMIYYPSYFNEGWAIHGSLSVPNRPVSHGCVRIPIVSAKELSDITPVGTVVLVYGSQASAVL